MRGGYDVITIMQRKSSVNRRSNRPCQGGNGGPETVPRIVRNLRSRGQIHINMIYQKSVSEVETETTGKSFLDCSIYETQKHLRQSCKTGKLPNLIVCVTFLYF